MRIVLELPVKLVEILKKLSENSGKTLEEEIGFASLYKGI
jgi:hypothetical protein